MIFTRSSYLSTSYRLFSTSRLTGVAADMLTADVGPLDDHNAAASSILVPTLSTPAAVPAPVLGLKGTVR